MKELKYFHSQDTLHHILGYDKTIQLRLFRIYTKIITRIQKDKNIIKQKKKTNNNEMEKKNNNPKSLNTDLRFSSHRKDTEIKELQCSTMLSLGNDCSFVLHID